jgi:hypothetical protein
MDKYLEAERRLAELLGWTYHNEPDRFGPRWRLPDGDWKSKLPRWCRDWSACGPLMVEHEVDLSYEDIYVRAVCRLPDGRERRELARYCDHPSRDAAVMFAGVQAVIAKLSTQQEG